MTLSRTLRHAAGLLGLAALSLSPAALFADIFTQTDLTANSASVGAANVDPNLINPWGMAFSATSPFWIADQGTNLSTLYSGTGSVNSTVVSIPSSSTPPSGPTGIVFNSTTGFDVTPGTASHFIFDTLQGTIAAWASGSTATTMVPSTGATYTGLALASSLGNNYLYAANSAGAGSINVFDSNFNNVTNTTFGGKFVDPNPIAGYVPFNVQLIGSDLYVMYAELGPHGVALVGSSGYVDVYDTSGNFIQRLATGGALFAPWGITLAPSNWGEFANDLLIGNFGNGEIDAYTTTGVFEGIIDGTNGQPIVNPNLWALDFRTGGTGVNTDALYFTAGIDNQAGGLFGDITVTTPEPSPLILTGFGILALFAASRLRRHHA